MHLLLFSRILRAGIWVQTFSSFPPFLDRIGDRISSFLAPELLGRALYVLSFGDLSGCILEVAEGSQTK